MDNIYYDGNLKASLTVGSVSDINPLNAYTKDQVNELLENKSDINHTHEQYLTEHQSLDHLALKEHTHDEYLTEHQDISHLATKEEIPSIKGLATVEYVNNQIDNIDIPEVDLSNCATKEELNEVKQSVSEGKKLIASAITDLGIPTLATDTWETMANNIRSLNPYYIEYTIEAASSTDKVDDQKYLPNIKNMGDTGLHRNYDAIIIKLNDGTTTSDLNTYAKDVSKITIYYNEKTEQIKFRGSMFTTVYVKEVNYIKTDNFTTFSGMFLGCRRLQRINNMDKWITDNVTEMGNMFCYCSSLKSLDLSNFNTSNVTSMGSMFTSCTSLTSLDLSNFDTSNVISMGLMFQSCSSLKTLKLSNFNTQNLILTNGMFQGCTSLEVLDLSSFNTNKVDINNSSNMLSGVPTNVDWCYDETNYANWTLTEEQTGFKGTFPWNKQEEELIASYTINDPNQLHTFNSDFEYRQENIDNGDSTYTVNLYSNSDFKSFKCNRYTLTIDYLKVNSNITNMSNMFDMCNSLTSLDLSNFNTENVTNMECMFANCNSLTSLDLSNFNTENVTNMECMFANCNSLTSLDLSNFNTSKVTKMGEMFLNCNSLTSLNLSSFDTNNVTEMFDMFYNVSADIDFCYDGSNYKNWTLTEEQTGFSGTFPWNQ